MNLKRSRTNNTCLLPKRPASYPGRSPPRPSKEQILHLLAVPNPDFHPDFGIPCRLVVWVRPNLGADFAQIWTGSAALCVISTKFGYSAGFGPGYAKSGINSTKCGPSSSTFITKIGMHPGKAGARQRRLDTRRYSKSAQRKGVSPSSRPNTVSPGTDPLHPACCSEARHYRPRRQSARHANTPLSSRALKRATGTPPKGTSTTRGGRPRGSPNFRSTSPEPPRATGCRNHPSTRRPTGRRRLRRRTPPNTVWNK